MSIQCHQEKAVGVSSRRDTEETTVSRKHKHSDDDQPGTSSKKKPAAAPVSNKNPDSWKSECLTLLKTINKCEDSIPFRLPVDIDEIPEYFDVIENPMDLSTVKENLLSDKYSNPNSLFRDLRLIFSNSRTFNTNKRSKIYASTLRLSAMVEEKMKEIIKSWNSAVKHVKKSSPQQTTGTSNFTSSAHSSRIIKRQQRRMAATAPSSSTRASSRKNRTGLSTAKTTTASHSDLNTSATTVEVDEADL